MPEGVKYQILRADIAGCPALPLEDFTDPAEAARVAKKLAKKMGEKLMVKPIVNPQWKLREKERFEDGTYRDLPWAGDRWWRSDAAYAIHRTHFAHPSLERPGFLAYTKSEEDGSIDRQTIVRPGAYLNKYFTGVIEAYGYSERRLVESFMLAYGPLDVKFATTEEEIIAVYEHGPETCMIGKGWPGDGRNPAQIYAAGDLQVAYLGTLQKASARTLVWPEKKIHSRVYGDIARLTAGLQRLGYKWGAPIGAKLKRIQVREFKFNPLKGPPTHCFVAPYIDKKNQQGGGHLSILDKGDHLVICEEGKPGSHHCGLAEGYSGYYVPREDEYPTYSCDRCDTPGFRELTTVLVNDMEDEASWCKRCIRAYAFQCGYSGRFVPIETEKVNVDGSYWAKPYADMYAVKCEKSGNLCHSDYVKSVFIGDRYWKVSQVWVENQGGSFKSTLTRKMFMNFDRKKVISRDLGTQIMGLPELKHHAFQCDGCREYAMIDERHQEGDKLFCFYCAEKSGLAKKPEAEKSAYNLPYSQIYTALMPKFNIR